MPFTVSHVAAVIPFHRPLARWRLFTAAVIGSMVPDFGLLWPVRLNRLETHSMIALLTFCLPVGLLSYWLTQVLIRPAIREVLPDGPYARLPTDDVNRLLWQWQRWLPVALTILAGAVTHLAWDLFTHEDSRGTRWFPVLNETGPDLHGHPTRLTLWLQYASSGLGMLVVLYAILLWWSHARPIATQPVARRLEAGERMAWLSLFALGVLAWVGRDFIHGIRRPVHWFARDVAIDAMRSVVVGLLFVSALIRLRVSGSGR